MLATLHQNIEPSITIFNYDLNKANTILFELTNTLNWILKHNLKDVDYNLILKKFGTIVEATSAYFFVKSDDSSQYNLMAIWNSINNIKMISNVKTDDYDILKKFINSNICFNGIVDNIDVKEKERLLELGIKSIAIIPIIGNLNKIIGFVGFNDCKMKRDWGEIEINALKSLGIIIGTIFTIKEEYTRHANEMLSAVSELRKIRQSLDITNEQLKRKIK